MVFGFTGTCHQPDSGLCSCQYLVFASALGPQTGNRISSVSYFGSLINRGSVYVSDPWFFYEKSSWRRPRDNGWLDWRTYHFRSHVWKNAGTWPSQNQCGFLLVNCELFSNKLACNAGLLQRPKVHQGPPWDFYGPMQTKTDWMCQLLSVVRGASGTKSHSTTFLFSLFFLCGKFPFHTRTAYVVRTFILVMQRFLLILPV